MNLRLQTIDAGKWSIITHIIVNFTRFASNIILARMLFPEAFGFIAVSSSIIIGLVLISDFGVRAVIIRKIEQIEDEFLFSAWTFQILRGFFVWVFLIFNCLIAFYFTSNNLLSNFGIFSDPNLYLYTIVMGFSIIINGFESSNVHNSIRNLDIKSVSIIEIISCVFTVIFVISLSYIWPSVWSLVLASVFASALSVVLTHTIVPGPKMSINFDKNHFREITSIGKWIAASSAATFITNQSDKIVLGFISYTSFIGVYYIAKSIIQAFENLSSRLVNTLLLSVLNKSRSDSEEEITSKFYKFRLPIDIFCAFSGGILFVFGEPIIKILYDVRYNEAGSVLKILSIGIAVYPFQLVRGRFTLGGETRIVAMNTIVEAISLVGCMFLGYKLYNLEGAIWGLAVHRFIPSITMLTIASQRDWVRWRIEFRVVLFFGISLVAAKLGIFSLWQLGLISEFQNP